MTTEEAHVTLVLPIMPISSVLRLQLSLPCINTAHAGTLSSSHAPKDFTSQRC